MKIAVLGATGMLGARVYEELLGAGHEVAPHTRLTIDLTRPWDYNQLLHAGFDWIVNCAGIVKSRVGEVSDVDTVIVNSAVPHWLEDGGARVLQISTDCVFSGAKGAYAPTDTPDPVDLYGASKLAGELRGPRSITIRTSFIGWEQASQRGLLEWFVRQKKVEGYARAIWSGLSAREVARAVKIAIEHSTAYSNTGGTLGQLYHLCGSPITKYKLLCELKRALKLDIEIVETLGPEIDRSLNGAKFNSTFFEYAPPTWETMAEELAREKPHA